MDNSNLAQNAKIIAPSDAVADYCRADRILTMKSTRFNPIPAALKKHIHQRLGTWFDQHKRPMLWRNTHDPYAVWLSEVMLQQTQVATVTPYYARFLQQFPDIQALAAAPLDEVLKIWAGLGYYRRAKSMHQAAQIIASTYHGIFPSTYDNMLKLPGIGRYTAGAIASIAFHETVPVLDGNVMRVLARLLLIRDNIATSQTQKRLWQIAEALVPQSNPGDFNQSLMELGATVCTPKHPRCESCPLKTFCMARQRNMQNQLPVKQRKAPTPHIEMAAVVINSPQGQLLAQRKAGGLWEHLWEFPAFELPRRNAATASQQLFHLTGLNIKLKRLTESVTHQLTHRHLEYTIFVGTSKSKRIPLLTTDLALHYESIRWISDMSDVPKSRLTEKISARSINRQQIPAAKPSAAK